MNVVLKNKPSILWLLLITLCKNLENNNWMKFGEFWALGFFLKILWYFSIAPFYFSKKFQNSTNFNQKNYKWSYICLFYVLGGIQNIKGVSKNSHFEYKRISFYKNHWFLIFFLNVSKKIFRKNISISSKQNTTKRDIFLNNYFLRIKILQIIRLYNWS
jgi:hypothetical protein